jgi:hypothetical protein
MLTCVVSPHVHSSFFSVCVQVYGPLPPGGNPIGVNKYIIYAFTAWRLGIGAILPIPYKSIHMKGVGKPDFPPTMLTEN